MLLVIVTWLRSSYKINYLYAAYLCSYKEEHISMANKDYKPVREDWLVKRRLHGYKSQFN